MRLSRSVNWWLLVQWRVGDVRERAQHRFARSEGGHGTEWSHCPLSFLWTFRKKIMEDDDVMGGSGIWMEHAHIHAWRILKTHWPARKMEPKRGGWNGGWGWNGRPLWASRQGESSQQLCICNHHINNSHRYSTKIFIAKGECWTLQSVAVLNGNIWSQFITELYRKEGIYFMLMGIRN